MPRLFWALAFPWSAALRYHATACASSCATPWPVAYITPRLNCVGAFPWSGALRYHATAIRASARTPPAKRVSTRCFTVRPMASWAPHKPRQRSRDRDAEIVKGPLMNDRAPAQFPGPVYPRRGGGKRSLTYFKFYDFIRRLGNHMNGLAAYFPARRDKPRACRNGN